MHLGIDEVKRLAVKVDRFCTANSIRDEEIACSILDVLFGRAMGVDPDEVLGPVSPAYKTVVVSYANRVECLK